MFYLIFFVKIDFLQKTPNDFSNLLSENCDVKLSSNMKSLLSSGPGNNLNERAIDNFNKSSMTIKTQKEDEEINNNVSTSFEISMNKIKQVEAKLALKIKENQILLLNIQSLEKEILQVIFIYEIY